MNIEIFPEYPTSSANDQSKKGYVSGPFRKARVHTQREQRFVH